MKITRKRLEAILRQKDEIENLAQQFAYEKRQGMRTGPIRFDDNGNIEMEVNTACHCHPEYEWTDIATKEEFCEWLDKQNQS